MISVVEEWNMVGMYFVEGTLPLNETSEMATLIG